MRTAISLFILSGLIVSGAAASAAPKTSAPRLIKRLVRKRPDLVFNFSFLRLFPNDAGVAARFNALLQRGMLADLPDQEMLRRLSRMVHRSRISRAPAQNKRGWERAEQIAKLVDAPDNYLDIGSGRGVIPGMLAELWDPATKQGVDIYPPASPQFPVKVYDGKRMPIESNSVDVATLLQVLHHDKDPLGKMKDAHRVLKPGGLLVVRESDIRNPTERHVAQVLDMLQVPAFKEPLDAPLPINLMSREHLELAARKMGLHPETKSFVEVDSPFRSYYTVFRKEP